MMIRLEPYGSKEPYVPKKPLIKSITKEELVYPDSPYSRNSLTFEGYLIKIEWGREIFLGITPEQSCCENAGAMMSHDDPSYFIGAEFLGVEKTDTKLKTESVDPYTGIDDQECIFLTIKTSKGDFQIAVYNQHNGYYGHSVMIDYGSGKVEKSGL